MKDLGPNASANDDLVDKETLDAAIAGVSAGSGLTAAAIHALTAKSPVVAGDELLVLDSAASFAAKRILISTLATYVTALITAGAPGTLDTLDELAAALADDANYAATITAALGLKAPLNSPTFTGTIAGITKAMVGLGSVDNTSDATKRTKRVSTLASNTVSVSVNADNFDVVEVAGLAGTITLNNPTGTPTPYQSLLYALTATATQTINVGTDFENGTLTRPTATTGTQQLLLAFMRIGSKWRYVGSA